MAAGAGNGDPGAGGAPNNIPAFQNRTVLIIAGVTLLIILLTIGILFAVNASKSLGEYRTLVDGLDQDRALEIAAQLENAGIEADITTAETGGSDVRVREKQYDTAVLEMAKSNLLNNDDFKLFDKTDWAASDYEKRVKYMRAVSGELSRLISRMDGIKWAKAHVTIPPEKIFSSRFSKDKTSASVTVENEPGKSLSQSQVSSILSLVNGYVPEIESGHISIIDTKGRVYASAYGDPDELGSVGGHNLAASVESANSSIERRVQSYLDGVVGSGKSKVAVSTRLAVEKLTKNTTNFYPGAIGTHEYSEEALGDAAGGSPYIGSASSYPPPQGNMPPQPRQINPNSLYPSMGGNGSNYQQNYSGQAPQPRVPSAPPYQSSNMDMVDSRLKKDMAGNSAYQAMNSENRGNQNNNVYSPPTSSGYPDASRPSDNPYDTAGLYSMGSMGMSQQQQQQMPPPDNNDPSRYVCAANDEVCKRNYRRHNFSIHSYPSYEQTYLEMAPGSVQSIKVSVVVDKDSVPVSIGQLKAGIAAAADPNMSPNDVEVVLRSGMSPASSEKKEKPKKGIFWNNSDEEKPKFNWWSILLGLGLVALVIFILSRIFTGSKRQPPDFRDESFLDLMPNRNPPPAQQPDLLDLKRGAPRSPFEQTAPLRQRSSQGFPPEEDNDFENDFPAPQSQSPPRPSQEEQNDDFPFDDEPFPSQPSQNQSNQDLPFDLDDEIEDRPKPRENNRRPEPRNDEDSKPTRRVQPRNRQKPRIVIEDE